MIGRKVECPKCNGSGTIPANDIDSFPFISPQDYAQDFSYFIICDLCNGEGKVKSSVSKKYSKEQS